MLAATAIALGVVVGAWVPARWNTPDPKSLDLIQGTPFNCLLVDRPHWRAELSDRAAEAGIQVLGVVRPGELEDAAGAAERARLSGLVLEGDFASGTADRLSSAGVVIELPPRAAMRFTGAVAGTYQGIWPGIRMDQKAAATGGPWVDTNYGFLAFARASSEAAPVWIANTPPPKTVLKVEKYLHAISDAAIAGARWVVALDPDFERRLFAREAAAVRDWKRIAEHARFYEEHRTWSEWPSHGRLAIVQEASGALYSGGILDMIAVKHTPVRAVPVAKLSPAALAGATMAVNADPEAVEPEQKEAFRLFARGGGTILTAPTGWKLPPPSKETITLGKDDVAKLDEVWKGINSMIGRANLGARLFNVSGMLSALTASPDGSTLALQLVNYTDYPVESITVHVLGKYARATLHEPGRPPRQLDIYAIEEGAGVDIPEVGAAAALVLERGVK
ncbi:MAG TPA: hypothetical protein VN428_08000 [Bryobacteraceae bacterium]|nr:hypothetical protein [Bryobacteraceae bacterium]